MGRLIDADAFAVTLKQISEKQGYAELYMNVDDVLNSVIDDLQGNALNGYENCPTVEAIPKADYEARLKADMVVVLDKIRAEIETKYGQCDICEYFEDYDYEENDISEYRPIGNIADILQIINKYKAESEVDNGNDN